MPPPAFAAFVLAFVVTATSAATYASSSPVYEVLLEWKDALLPCTCANRTIDCSYRRKSSIEAEDVCDAAPVALNLYNNLFTSFPDGFTSATSVNASRNRLSAFPRASQLNSQLTVLDLSRNVISVASDELRELSSLEILNVGGNRLSHLQFLPEVCALKRLDVSRNKLTDLDGRLSRCTQLKELHLQNNDLTSLPNGIFNGMYQLQILSLNDNPLGGALTSQVFDNLINLRKLDLYSIQLTSFPPGIFKSLSKLEELDIGLNDLSSLQENVFSSLSNLKFLRMIRGNMQIFPTEIFSPVSQLQTLHLSVNFFTTLPPDAFIHLPHLKMLTMDILNATSLPENIFTNLTELEVLSLYANRLTSLPDGLLFGLNKLEKVDLSANRWTELPLQQITNVKKVSLGNIGINSLGPRMFVRIPRVSLLVLNHNNISLVAENAFEGLRLEGLVLGANILSELPSNVFQGQAKLKYIDLSTNSLVSLPEGIFSGLNNLQVLELAYNRLETLPNQIFQHLSALEVLDLSGNKLSAVNAGWFTNLRSLRKLALDRNRLTVLPSVPRPHAAQLHVSFTGNSIAQPDRHALQLSLSGEDQLFLDLTENRVTPSAVSWLLNEQQVRLGVDPHSPCHCGYVRHRHAVMHICVDTTCSRSQQQQRQQQATTWVDALRTARK